MTRIPGRSPHLSPYLGSAVPKLPGDDAPGVEPPPALKERIMDVIHAEAGAAVCGSQPAVLRASASCASAPGAGATLTVDGDRAVLSAWGLPAPPPGSVYRVWLLRGTAPCVPEPGPALTLDAAGRARLELTAVAGTAEIAVAVDGAATPALRVTVPSSVGARDGR